MQFKVVKQQTTTIIKEIHPTPAQPLPFLSQRKTVEIQRDLPDAVSNCIDLKSTISQELVGCKLNRKLRVKGA
jgi:hypothetical protein